MLYEKMQDGIVCCGLCSHRCRITQGRSGVCGVRKNRDGTLYTVVYGRPVALHIDPIEKKPLYHFLPGSHSYSIATIGCNFRCLFCQNWEISQSPKEGITEAEMPYVPPEDIVRRAKKAGCRSISYTYTEPTIFFEYAYDIARLAKKAGLYNTFVTNGYMTPEALDTIRPYLDACNVDLKSYSDGFYRDMCGSRLVPVLEAIRHMKTLGIWVEVTTLLIPGRNDSDKELEGIANFIADTGRETPWHISRFYPNYRYTDSSPTPLESLRRARDIGKKAGLKYIYLGNVVEGNDTHCYKCGGLLIRRVLFEAQSYIGRDGICHKCGERLEGVF